MSKINDKGVSLHEIFEKQGDDLVNLFHEFDGDRKTEFIEKYPEIWDDVYDIMEDSRYHRAIKKIARQSYTAALNDAQACVDELEARYARLQSKVDGLLKALEEHYEYAQECRMDWSEYDGRAHLRVAESINHEAATRKLLPILEAALSMAEFYNKLSIKIPHASSCLAVDMGDESFCNCEKKKARDFQALVAEMIKEGK